VSHFLTVPEKLIPSIQVLIPGPILRPRVRPHSSANNFESLWPKEHSQRRVLRVKFCQPSGIGESPLWRQRAPGVNPAIRLQGLSQLLDPNARAEKWLTNERRQMRALRDSAGPLCSEAEGDMPDLPRVVHLFHQPARPRQVPLSAPHKLIRKSRMQLRPRCL
jgi:hypothetical protein